MPVLYLWLALYPDLGPSLQPSDERADTFTTQPIRLAYLQCLSSYVPAVGQSILRRTPLVLFPAGIVLGPEGMHEFVDQVEDGHPEGKAALLLTPHGHEERVEAVRLASGQDEIETKAEEKLGERISFMCQFPYLKKAPLYLNQLSRLEYDFELEAVKFHWEHG